MAHRNILRWRKDRAAMHAIDEWINLDEYDRACALALRLATMRCGFGSIFSPGSAFDDNDVRDA